MTNRLELNWKLDGFVDEQRYYCSETPIDPENPPAPKVILAGDIRTYTDTDIESGKTYYVRVGSVKGSIEKVSQEVEISAGSDPHWDNVVALLHFNGDLTDETGRSWTLGSASKINSSTPIFGSGSLETTGLGGGCYTANPIGDASAKFTIETFINVLAWPPPANGYGATDWMAVWGQTNSSGAGEFGLWFQGGSIMLDLRGGVGGLIFSHPWTPIVGTIYHIAHTYDGGKHRVFINGSKTIEVTQGFGWKNTSEPFRIGQMLNPVGPAYRAGGYCLYDSFRITKGVARYTENFTPPDSPFLNY